MTGSHLTNSFTQDGIDSSTVKLAARGTFLLAQATQHFFLCCSDRETKLLHVCSYSDPATKLPRQGCRTFVKMNFPQHFADIVGDYTPNRLRILLKNSSEGDV